MNRRVMRRQPFALGFLLVLAACTTIRLVSEYDAITDKSATDMQHKVDQFLLKMETAAGTPSGTYDANVATYDELQADADALRVRATAVPDNALTLTQLSALDQTLADLRKLHQLEGAKGLTKTVAEPSRAAFTSIFTAIIKLELAKQRGERPPTS